MKTFEKLSLFEARAKLNELNLPFDRCITPECSYRPRIDSPRDMHDTIIYFMHGKTDVAYYLPTVEALCVHDTPRVWGDDFIRGCVPC